MPPAPAPGREVQFENIPPSLADHPHFVLWAFGPRINAAGKHEKRPKQRSGADASWNKVTTHCTLAEAKFTYEHISFNGVGVVLMNGLCGIDLDHVLTATGVVESWAQAILDKFAGSYIEVSPGGDGFHILCRGKTGHNGKQGPGDRLETYDQGRYFTVTGDRWPAGAMEITEQQEALDWLHATHGKAQAAPAPAPAKSNVVPMVRTSASNREEIKPDGWIIERISKKDNGLWQGTTQVNGNSGDLALCNKIAYYNPDPVAIDRIFRLSGRMRPKWDEKRGAETYGQMTVNKALSEGTSAQAGRAARAEHAAKQAAKATGWGAAPAGELETVQRWEAPLISPTLTYHPDQMVWKTDKQGEMRFIKAKATTENFGRLIAAYGVKVRYNEMAKTIEVEYPGKATGGDLANSTDITMLESLCKLNDFPARDVANDMAVLAEKDSYNPARDWVKSKPWDGVERLDSLFECLTLKDESKAALSRKLFRKWLLGAVALLTGRTASFEFVLVLVDPHGGTGKTRFFKTFCPSDFQASGVTLDLQAKDSILKVVKRWLVELGELDGSLNKNDIARLKAFLGDEVDSIRLPYGRNQLDFRRKTAFFSSVNDVKFLTDDTSNRRFWPVEVTSVVFDHAIDMQQVWAEAVAALDAGGTWYLSQEENKEIGEHNASFRAKSAIEEAILEAYDPAQPCTRKLSAKGVLSELGIYTPNRIQMREAGSTLRKLFAFTNPKNVETFELPARRFAGGNY
jgi:hypothetical protein